MRFGLKVCPAQYERSENPLVFGMPTDNTDLFRACVKTVRMKWKSQGEDAPPHILGKGSRERRSCQFTDKSRLLVKQITNLRDLIVRYRKPYLEVTPSLVSTDQMTDEERDRVDRDCSSIASACSLLVKELKVECDAAHHSPQAVLVYRAVVELVEGYLRAVTTVTSQLTATRNRWKSRLNRIGNSPPDSRPPRPLPLPQEEPSLSQEEIQAFQLENDLLYNDLNAVNDEVRAIERKVVKISELQEVFTEKVVEQNEELERINCTLVGTSENMREANQQIRSAIQNNAGLRIYVLFFLLVMSFSLLFLDWYND